MASRKRRRFGDVSIGGHSLKAAITKPTFVVLAGAAVGGYFLPKYINDMNWSVGALTGAALAVLVATFV